MLCSSTNVKQLQAFLVAILRVHGSTAAGERAERAQRGQQPFGQRLNDL